MLKINTQISKFLGDLSSLDLRSLALFRVVIALVMLINTWCYWPNIDTFFVAPTGFYQLSEVSYYYSYVYNWSLLYLSNNSHFLHGFFLVYLFIAILLLFGYKTRLVVIIAWILSISIKNRGLPYNSLADVQLVVFLFWAMFLPLGAKFSVDSALNKQTPTNRYVSIACLAFILNIVYLYFMGALEKFHPIWTQEFTAVYYSLNTVQTTTPLAPLFLKLGFGLKILSGVVYYLELIGPILLFLPWRNELIRFGIVMLLILQHVGIALCLSIGIFPLISIACLAAMLPAFFWDQILSKLSIINPTKKPKIFYDQNCQFCLKVTRILCSLSMLPRSVIIPAEEDESASRIMQDKNSWVVLPNQGSYLTGWSAVAYILRRSPILFLLGYLSMLPGFAQLGELIYRLIAKSRSSLGKITKYFLPFTDQAIYRPWKITQVFLVVLMSLVLVLNLYNVELISLSSAGPLRNALRIFGLKQEWDMYAPYPKTSSRWLVIEGELNNGQIVDLLHSKTTPPIYDKPNNGWELFSNFRWRKFFSRVDWHRRGARVAIYFCDKWKQLHPELPIKEIRVIKYKQKTPPPGSGDKPGARFKQRAFEASCDLKLQ